MTVLRAFKHIWEQLIEPQRYLKKTGIDLLAEQRTQWQLHGKQFVTISSMSQNSKLLIYVFLFRITQNTVGTSVEYLEA